MRKFLFISIFSATISCDSEIENSSSLQENSIQIEITFLPFLDWVTTSDYLTGDLGLTQDSTSGNITGTHSFVNHNGTRIDFCEWNSLGFQFIDKNLWEGSMEDCYDGSTHDVRMELLSKSELRFILTINNHEFLPDTIYFEPENK